MDGTIIFLNSLQLRKIFIFVLGVVIFSSSILYQKVYADDSVWDWWAKTQENIGSAIECAVSSYTTGGYQFDPQNFEKELECLNKIFETTPQLYSKIIYAQDLLRAYIVKFDSKQITVLLEQLSQETDGIDWQNYRSETAPKITNYVTQMLITENSNQKEIDRLNRNQGLVNEGMILAAKSIPIIDPDTKSVSTLDTFAANQVEKIPALKNSDIGKDPVRAGMLLILDKEYILYVQIIPTPNGDLISLEEASLITHRDEFKKAKSIAKFANLISHGKDPTLYQQNAHVFFELIREANGNEEIDKDLVYSEYLLSLTPEELLNLEFETADGELTSISKISTVSCGKNEINIIDTAWKAYNISHGNQNVTQLDYDFRNIVSMLSNYNDNKICN